MLCVACHRVNGNRLCPSCMTSVRPATERLLPDGIRLVAAFEHTGAAVHLVHHLKYRGLTSFARLVGEVLSERVTPAPLVPIPRAWSRRYKHGVDPAQEIADALGEIWGLPVLHALERPLHARRRAGRNHGAPVTAFRSRGAVSAPIHVVDDVITTGATARAAVAAIGQNKLESVLAANVVPRVSSLSPK